MLLEFVVLELAPSGTGAGLADSSMHAQPGGSQALGGFTYTRKSETDLNATLEAMQRGSKVKILQRPRIQTADGVEANLFVGEKRRSAATTNSALSNDQLIGLSLNVLPRITPDSKICLDVHLKQDSYTGTAYVQGRNVPVTTTREAGAKLQLEDRQTVILGGLIGQAEVREPLRLLSPKELAGLGRNASRGQPETREILTFIRPTLL